MDTKKNMNILDQHLRYILNPYNEDVMNMDHNNDEQVYRALFKIIKGERTAGGKIKNKIKISKKRPQWVERLYQN